MVNDYSALRRKRRRWAYRIFGPSTVHLRYECYLALSTFLFSLSVLRTLHGDDDFYFSLETLFSKQNFLFLLLLNGWMSRYLIVRWLCTWDLSTAKSPTLRGLFSCFLASHVMVGHTFDQPPYNHEASKALLMSHAHSSNTQSSSSNNKSHPFDSHSRTSSSSSLFALPNILIYAIQLVRVRIWYPLCEFLFGNSTRSQVWVPLSSSFSLDPVRNSRYRVVRWLAVLLSGMEAVVARFCPSLMFLTLVAVLSTYGTKLLQALMEKPPLPNIPLHAKGIILGKSPDSNSNNNKDSEDDGAYGAYAPFFPDQQDWGFLFWLVSYFSILFSVYRYGCIVPPVMDQIAGNNVVKDLRNERKRGSHHHNSRFGMTPLAEITKRFVQGNRILLNIDHIVLRVIEYLNVLMASPRSTYFRKVLMTNQERGLELDARQAILNFAGITKPLRDPINVPQSWSLDMAYMMSITWILIGVAVTSFSILSAQALILDRSYLSTLGYLGTFWMPVEAAEAEQLDQRSLSQWDSKRKYKKNDVVLVGQRMYRAAVNDPESLPPKWWMCRPQSMLADEVGHSTTSNILANIAQCQLAMLFVFIGLWLTLTTIGVRTAGLVEAIAACAVGCCALDDDLASLKRQTRSLRRLAREISA